MHISKNVFVVFCSSLSSIANGNVTYSTPLTEAGYIVDTLAEFYCDSGYKSSELPQNQGDVKDQETGLEKLNYVLRVMRVACYFNSYQIFLFIYTSRQLCI